MTHVLVVDDREENAYYLTVLLSAHGCQVTVARNGIEALASARSAPPGVVISDLLMPGMDGYTLLRHWKADELLKRIPFIVYTATYTDPEDEQLALNLGADAFILKPADPEAFLARLRSVQANERAARPVPVRSPASEESVLLREYNEALVRKLEARTVELEESNRKLLEDLAARRKMEAALRESEERFRQLAENVDEVFWLSDLRGRVFYANPAFEVVWGAAREALYRVPEQWLHAVHGDDRARVEASLVSYGSSGWDESFRVVRPDGTVRFVRARAYPVRDPAGSVYRVAVLSRDITDYHRLEEQFRHAQKMEAVGRLASGVAHDFNNLLSIILSYTALALERSGPDGPLFEEVAEIQQAGERAADLTRQLLAFSRQQVREPQVLALSELVHRMEKMLRRLLGEDVVLALRLDDGDTAIYADPTQLEQVVMNLAVNARDAMPNGGHLTIEVARRMLGASDAGPAGDYVVLSVDDDGVGMDEATRDRMFEPFFTTKELGRGTGLGLSTVFGIVQQSHGAVHVTSAPGRGSRFEVVLPATKQRPAAPRRERVGPAPRGSETILLVEDDRQVRRMNRTVLERHGYRVLDACDGREALAMCEAYDGPIALLLTDVVMPNMGGRELAERLARSAPSLKVLYVSGYPQDAIVQRGVFDGALPLLPKPTTPERLLHKVREVLDAPAGLPLA